MSELDLDAIEAREAEVMECGFYPSSRWSAGSVLSDVRVLVVELRKLREENARLKAPVDTKGIERSCDDCQQPYAVWFAPNETWNFVMGGADCKGDPGGMLCPRCFTLRAEAAGVVPTAWEVRPERFLDEENRWIPVEERLPEKYGPVLGVVNGEVRQRYFSKKIGFLHDRRAELSAFGTVTHWQEMPAGPVGTL